jgi:molybdopterin/thiamine biosynthesis adenylyltransferase
LRALIDALQESKKMVQGVSVIPLAELDKLAVEFGLSRRQAEIAALEAHIVPQRYVRNLGTVGLAGQLRLLQAGVAVVGLGGLGGYIVEALARMGIGRLILVDGDVFCDHNLNRQVLSREDNLGQLKAHAAAERVRQVNQAVEVVPVPQFATSENLPSLLSTADVVVDALDRLPVRIMLQDVAAQAGIPMVHGAIAGSMGQVMTIFPGDIGLRALYGNGDVPEHGVEVELGTPSASPMMVAAWQVNETVKILCRLGQLLRGRMLFMDAQAGETRILEL